jgi:endonuclease-8
LPEGDTIFRAAQTLHRYLAGKVVTRFESVVPALTRVSEDSPIVGRTIQSIAALGKNLIIEFSGDLILRTHMRMNGSWHIYPAHAPWRRPVREMRVLVGTADAVAVGFNVPVADFVNARELSRHKPLQSLGHDLLGARFDRDEALRRIRTRGAEPIGDVLLNQRVVAGIGNVFKSEILFAAGINPFIRATQLSDAQLRDVLDAAVAQLRANVMSPAQTLSTAIGRRTTRSLDPREKLWVYGRRGRPCRRCGTPIQARAGGTDARLTFWCPKCQQDR